MGREVGVAHGRVLSCPHVTRAPGPEGGAANREVGSPAPTSPGCPPSLPFPTLPSQS